MPQKFQDLNISYTKKNFLIGGCITHVKITASYNWYKFLRYVYVITHTHIRLTSLFPGLSGWAGARKVKLIWISLKQETVSGSSISWVVCKSAPRSRQITTPAPHHSVFYRLDAIPAAQPTASKHWRHYSCYQENINQYHRTELSSQHDNKVLEWEKSK